MNVSYRRIACSLLLICPLLAAAEGKPADTTRAKRASNTFQQMERNFVHIPNSVQTSVYWYWISGNISKEGVIQDLESMKKVGINRAFIGNIGLSDIPYGKVKLFSAEWWDIMHTALKTATRLNIEIGIFNSPGWSQSGGPWVKPGQAMRYLASSQTTITGPQLVNQKLVQPQKDFQDVRVVAYPVADDYESDISSANAKISSTPSVANLNNLTDHNEQTGITLKEKQDFTLDIASQQPYTVRSLTIIPNQKAMSFDGDIQVKNNGTYQTVKHFTVDRSNPALNVGFRPYGPAAISIPATTATDYRIVFTNVSGEAGITELKLSSTPVVESYIEKTEAKMWQTPYPYWDAYQWQRQPVVDDKKYVIDPAKVIDISRYMAADGTLKWNAPAGKWIIERTGMTPTQVQNSPAPPEATGLEADKMSKKHIRAHFDAYLGEILRRIPAADRKTFKVTVEDSYETGGQNWSDGLIENFKTAYGYDPTPYIPVLQGKVVGSEDQSDRFLWDLRRFVADNVAYQYVAGLREVSHQHGLHTWLENYGHWGFPGEFLQYGGQSDEVGGEFWSEGTLGNIENRAASSSAHIYGKTKVSAESFTCAGALFSRYPAMMKQRADRFFTEGINNTLMHVYIEQPYEDRYPGVNAWFGNEFNRHNTWFYDMDIFLKYIKRCNMMLQQGRYVADVAYFISEDAPKMTGTQEPALPRGYSFDYINGEVIKTRLTVKNGKLTLPDGLNYSILVLPKLETIRPELLRKIKQLVSEGAVVLGPKPLRSPSLQNFPAADAEVQKLAAELWGNIDGKTTKINKVGKGMVIDGMDLQQALEMIKVIPDMKTPATDSVLFIHRRVVDGSIYFVSNQTNKTININPEFRVVGKDPELWDPVSGSVRKLLVRQSNEGSITVPLQLSAMESAFVIFKTDDKRLITKPTNYPAPSKTIAVDAPWSVTFDTKMRGPAKPVIFNTLTDWSQTQNDSVKYYSGSAWYHNTADVAALQKGETAFIDLGMVKGIAKVKVNGVDLGGAWTAPYKVDITKALKPGKNSIEIKVVNTWVNRLIGDSKLPPAERKTWTSTNSYTPESKLEESGLLGPVKIEVVRY
jgi:hypothetical protein